MDYIKRDIPHLANEIKNALGFQQCRVDQNGEYLNVLVTDTRFAESFEKVCLKVMSHLRKKDPIRGVKTVQVRVKKVCEFRSTYKYLLGGSHE